MLTSKILKTIEENNSQNCGIILVQSIGKESKVKDRKTEGIIKLEKTLNDTTVVFPSSWDSNV